MGRRENLPNGQASWQGTLRVPPCLSPRTCQHCQIDTCQPTHVREQEREPGQQANLVARGTPSPTLLFATVPTYAPKKIRLRCSRVHQRTYPKKQTKNDTHTHSTFVCFFFSPRQGAGGYQNQAKTILVGKNKKLFIIRPEIARRSGFASRSDLGEKEGSVRDACGLTIAQGCCDRFFQR